MVLVAKIRKQIHGNKTKHQLPDPRQRQLVIDSGAIITSLTGNASYPSPDPTLPVLTAVRAAFIGAIEEAMHRDVDKVSVRRARRAELISLFRQVATYVEGNCGGDLAVLQSSGFPTQKPTREPVGPLPAPAAPIVRQGPTDGTLTARARKVDGAYVYNWRIALASTPAVYAQTAQTTAARCTFYDLTPGQIYIVQLDVVGTAGESSWSGVGTRMVI